MFMYTQEEFYGRPVIIADREMVESSSDAILASSSTTDVAFLVVGDPFGYFPSPIGTPYTHS